MTPPLCACPRGCYSDLLCMQQILVTGGAGFIGSHLCEALLARGYGVTCLDNFSTGSWDNIRHLSTLRLVEGDVNDAATVAALQPERFEAVFHYAAMVGVRRTDEDPTGVLHDVQGLQHMAALARQGAARKIIFSSSSEVYGQSPPLPQAEVDGGIGWNPYATVKVYGEQLFSALWRQYGIPTVSLRFFNVYGPRQRGSSYGFVVSRFIEQVLAGRSPTIFGNGFQTRDFVYVADNVRAALAALNHATAHGSVINVGSGRETRIVDLATRLIRCAGHIPAPPPAFVAGRAVEVMRRCASVKKMKRLLQTSCTVSLDQGLDLTLAVPARLSPSEQMVGTVPTHVS